MFLIPKLGKIQKSQEDISTILDYLSQLPEFQAPYEVLKELCRYISYSFFEQGNYEKQDRALYIIRGQVIAENGQVFQSDQWFDLDMGFYAVLETHCMTLFRPQYNKFSAQHGSSYLAKKECIIQNIGALSKINSSKIFEQFIQQFQEVILPMNNYITRSEESGTTIYILSTGKIQISKYHQKSMTAYERQVLPKKFWVTEIQISEQNDCGIIGEEFITQENALYNSKIISKTAVLYSISVQQLKQFPQVIAQSLTKLFKEKQQQRESIFLQKCQDIEKNWQTQNKQSILNQEIRKVISCKTVNKPNFKQDQQIQTQDLSDFQRTKTPYKKVPTFVQQYFKQKHIESSKNTNQITLEQFIQRQQNCSNPYQLFEQVHDPLSYIQKGPNYKRQQFSIFVQQGIVKIKQPDYPKPQGKRPLTQQKSQIIEVDQILERQKISSMHTPKPIVKSLRRFYRSQSANKLTFGFKQMKPNQTNQKSPRRDNMFYLRSGSSGLLHLNLNKSQQNYSQSGMISTEKVIRNQSLFD